jgi:hypothetical protein
LAQIVDSGATCESLETRFCDRLADDGDTPDSVRHKIDLLLHPFDMSSCDGLGDDQLFISSDPDSHLSLLAPEQYFVASKIIKAVLHETYQLMFLQASAGTEKTFTVKALINVPQSHRKKCFICGITDIAAVWYPGGTTLHSLFRLGIDEQSRGGFRSNIGRGTPLARYILAADLIVIDEVSMSTPWVPNRVSLTLQSISGYERIQFDGKRIFFVGDLLQLAPSVTSLIYQRWQKWISGQRPVQSHDIGQLTQSLKASFQHVGQFDHDLQGVQPTPQHLCFPLKFD